MAKAKPCKCAETVNMELAKFNTKLSRLLMLTADMDATTRLVIKTEKIDPKKRGQPKSVTPGFCPFCGKRTP